MVPLNSTLFLTDRPRNNEPTLVCLACAHPLPSSSHRPTRYFQIASLFGLAGVTFGMGLVASLANFVIDEHAAAALRERIHASSLAGTISSDDGLTRRIDAAAKGEGESLLWEEEGGWGVGEGKSR